MRNNLCVFIGLFIIIFEAKVLCQEDSSSAEEGFSCKKPWKKVYTGCYLFVKDTFQTWQDAQNNCVSEGGNLFSISDDTELEKVTQKIRQQITSLDLLEWWLGLRYMPDVDKWQWTDGSYFTVDDIDMWAQGEPNNGHTDNPDDFLGKEECAAITYQNKLRDLRCQEKKPYVCEITMVNETTSPALTSTTTTSSTALTTARAISTTTTSSTVLTSTTKRKTTPAVTAETTVTPAEPDTQSPTVKSTSQSPVTTRKQTTQETEKSTTQKATIQTTKDTTEGEITESSGTQATKVTESDKSSSSSSTSSDLTPTRSMTTSPAVTMITTPAGRDLSNFTGCYSINYDTKCPALKTLGVSWPMTEAGVTASVACGHGSAIWRCQAVPVVCWKGEPDVTSCTSQAIQDLTNKVEEIVNSENNSAATLDFMENISVTLDGQVLLEQDIYQSAKLMSTASKANPENEQVAKEIVSSALKCGNSIISSSRNSVQMTSETKTMIASSVLGAMENITMSMMNIINTPSIARIQQPNMSVELHVVNLDDMDSSGINSVKYEGKENSFKIPTQTLRYYSTGELAKLVFIEYEAIGKLLEPTSQGRDDKVKRQVISDVMSASIGQSNDVPHPNVSQPMITFTFETGKRGNREDWEQLCSFWDFSQGHTGAWSQKGCKLKTYNVTHTVCQCSHLTNFAILMDIHATEIPSVHATSLIYITYVGCIISIICLFLSLVTFTCLSSVQGERNSIHKNLAFCLLVAEVLFLAGVERTENKIACSIIAGFLHFFFLSCFAWMFVEGIHILFMLVQVFDSAKSRLKYYYLVGYGGPVLVVGISAAVYHEGYGTDKYCWLTTERLFLWSFAGPVAFILLVNLMILIYAMTSVCRHSEYVFTKDKSTVGKMKGWIQGALALEVLLGLTWVFGYFYISEEALAVAYLFTIFNSLQGLFIFVFHCLLNKKVRKEYQRFIDYKPNLGTTHTTSKSANGTAGNGTGSSGLPLHNSRKQSGFSDISIGRHGSSSA